MQTSVANSKPHSVYYILDSFDRIADVSDTWGETAPESDQSKSLKNSVVGGGLRDFVKGDEVIGFLNTLFFWCRFENRVYETLYRCDGPDTPRLFRMIVQPRPDEHILVEHRLISQTQRPSMGRAAPFFGPKCSICCRYNIDSVWVDPFTSARGDYQVTEHVFCPDCRDRLSSGLVAKPDDLAKDAS